MVIYSTVRRTVNPLNQLASSIAIIKYKRSLFSQEHGSWKLNEKKENSQEQQNTMESLQPKNSVR